MIALSVVLISKDQEFNISRLIESVLNETRPYPNVEIVLVDSASTDCTTEIAAQYPITVLKLYPDQRLTAAAGRYVGFNQTTGDLILFLDGDMELCAGWLGQALHVLDTQPSVAVITGKVIDLPKETKRSDEKQSLPSPTVTADMISVRHGGGAAMYRRNVLNQIGSFNPYLYADEEPELCLRIRNAGYQILKLLRPIVFHYTVPFQAVSTFLNKRKHNFFLGFGQNTRNFWGTPLLMAYLRERGWGIPPALYILLGLAALAVSLLSGQWIWLGLWLVFLVVVVLGLTIQKRSLRNALFVLFRQLLILEGTIRGFFLKPSSATDYPGRYEIIRIGRTAK